jgi:O-antigen ligase
LQALVSTVYAKYIYAVLLLYLAAGLYFTYKDFYWFWLLPGALAVVGFTIWRMHWVFLAIAFLVPLSVNLEQLDFGLGISLPTEPLLAGLMLVFLFKVFLEGRYDHRILKQGITVAIFLHLLWILITVFTSALPVVSIKFFIARLWFVVPAFFLGVLVFKYPKNIDRFFALSIVPLAVVIIYSVINLALRGFAEKPAHWVMQPFYKDHTSYGAMVAFFIPVLLAWLSSPRLRATTKMAVSVLLLIFVAGVIFSYTRAAWVSLAAGFAVWLVIVLRIHIKYLLLAGLLAGGLLWSVQDQIMQKLEKNRQDSSSDLSEHVASISNVATDASNLERLNRWAAAMEMFKERPVLGHGPGTYSFLYAPYQHSSRITIISTNFGDGGNAHSEYFGPLAEMGVSGALAFLLIVFMFYYTAIPLYYRVFDRHIAQLLLAAIIAMTTYLVHGVLNNFLDLDKASIPFWACMAIVVAVKVYHAVPQPDLSE